MNSNSTITASLTRTIKFFIALLVLCSAGTSLQAQKQRITQFTQSDLSAELSTYLSDATSDKDKRAEVERHMKHFSMHYLALGTEMQGRVTGICNNMLKLKMRQHPDMMHFVQVFVKMCQQGNTSNFDQWVSGIEYIQNRNKKIKDFTDFIDFTDDFVSSRTLTASRSCTWQMQSGCSYTIRFETAA